MLPWTAFYYRGTLATGDIIVLPVLAATFSLPSPSLVSGTSLALPSLSVVSQSDVSEVDGTSLLLASLSQTITLYDPSIVEVPYPVIPTLPVSLELLPFTILDGSVVPIETLHIHCDTTTMVYDVSVCNLPQITCSVGSVLQVLDAATIEMPLYSVSVGLQSVPIVDGLLAQIPTLNAIASIQAIVEVDGAVLRPSPLQVTLSIYAWTAEDATSISVPSVSVNASIHDLLAVDSTIVSLPVVEVEASLHAFWVILEHEPIWFNTVLCSGVAWVQQFDSGIGENAELGSGAALYGRFDSGIESGVRFDTGFAATADTEGEEYKP